MKDHVRRLDEAQRFHGEQIGIAGPRAHQPHFAAFLNGRFAQGRQGQPPRGAGFRIAYLPLRELMEQGLALFSAGMNLQHFAAEFAHAREPGAEILGKLGVDFAAQALRHRGAFAGSRNRDLQIAAGHHGAEEEIAVGNVVDAVAEDAALEGGVIDGGVDFRGIGRGNHEVVAIEVGGIERLFNPFEFAFMRQVGVPLPLRCGAITRKLHAGLEQAADLFQRDGAGADQQASAAFEFEEDGQQAHGWSLWSSPLASGLPPCAH